MPTRSVAAALLSVILLGTAMLPAAFGLSQRSARMSCCTSEATCPMHHRAASAVPCFNACSGHSNAAPAPLPQVRATLNDAMPLTPHIAFVRFGTTTDRIVLCASADPVTPPPRLA